MQERNEKLNKLAKDVLILSRNTLLVNLRFLDRAISSLELYPIEKSSLMTDGQHILYNPEHIIGLYKLAKEIPARDYLHIIMHCVFRHMYMNPTLDRTYWDLACDIAVENVITELGIRATSAAREKQQEKYINEIKKELKYITAEKIYAYLKNALPDKKKVAELRGLFYADNHEIWYMTAKEIEAEYGLITMTQSRGEKASEWQSISEHMQMDIEVFSKKQGILPGGLTQNLASVNREKYDYTSFLKKFAVMG